MIHATLYVQQCAFNSEHHTEKWIVSISLISGNVTPQLSFFYRFYTFKLLHLNQVVIISNTLIEKQTKFIDRLICYVCFTNLLLVSVCNSLWCVFYCAFTEFTFLFFSGTGLCCIYLQIYSPQNPCYPQLSTELSIELVHIRCGHGQQRSVGRSVYLYVAPNSLYSHNGAGRLLRHLTPSVREQVGLQLAEITEETPVKGSMVKVFLPGRTLE